MKKPVKIAIATILVISLTILAGLSEAKKTESRIPRLEAFNITVYPQWLKLRQTQANMSSFSFTFESTATEPMSLQNVTVLLSSPQGVKVENISLILGINGTRLVLPAVFSEKNHTIILMASGINLTVPVKKQIEIKIAYIPEVDASSLTSKTANMTCTLLLDGYKLTNTIHLWTNASLKMVAKGQGTQINMYTNVTLTGNNSLILRATTENPLALCITGADILVATNPASKDFSMTQDGNCLKITGAGRLPQTITVQAQLKVQKQDSPIATISMQLKVGNRTITVKQTTIEAGKILSIRKPYIIPYILTLTTPEPINGTLTLKIGETTRQTRLTMGKATLILPEAFWPILTPIPIQATEITLDGTQTTFYAVQDQPETIIPGIATLALVAIIALATGFILYRERKRNKKKNPPPITEFIEEIEIS